MTPSTADDYAGRYVHYGIREHGMAAAMNGIALHGGLRPYGGTFLAFADYCRPAIRLSALMGLPVIYVMTHDSIGLGEDGPTHQPVEHLAIAARHPEPDRDPPRRRGRDGRGLGDGDGRDDRADASSACRARTCRPSARAHSDDNLTARGAYVLREAEARAR